MSDSDMLSLFLRSSTNCGSKSGLSFGDIVADLSLRSLFFWWSREAYRNFIERLSTWRSISFLNG
jgi:hypothetical protein